MKVTMKQTVEDSNEFLLDELKGVPKKLKSTIGYRERKVKDKVVSVCRVDKLMQGEEYDLPESQANELKKLGYAA